MKYIYYALYDVCYISDQPSGLSVELISERSLKCLPGAGVVCPPPHSDDGEVTGRYIMCSAPRAGRRGEEREDRENRVRV